MAMTQEKGGKRRALGRGLDSLLPKAAPKAEPAGVSEPGWPVETQAVTPAPSPAALGRPLEVSLEKVDRNPFQTRDTINETAMQELVASIREVGVLQPVLVRAVGDRYEVIAGERRWRAAQRAGLETIPIALMVMNDTQAMEATIIENLQRADLNPMEQARAFERLQREFHMTQEQVAVRTGKDRASIANFLRLLRLPGPLQRAVSEGELSFGHARALLALPTPEQMLRAAQRVQALAMSVRQTETYVKGLLNPEPRSAAKEAEPVDPNVREAQDTLRRALGMRVSIEDRAGRGKVVIEYANLEAFDVLMERLVGR